MNGSGDLSSLSDLAGQVRDSFRFQPEMSRIFREYECLS